MAGRKARISPEYTLKRKYNFGRIFVTGCVPDVVKWELSVQPVMKISFKWHFSLNISHQLSAQICMMTPSNVKISALLALCVGIHRSPVNSPHKGQWRGALVISLSKQLRRWWFETPSRPLWRQCNVINYFVAAISSHGGHPLVLLVISD